MNRIKDVREAAGQTRKQLGDAVGVTQHTIRRYELGEMSISLDMLGRVATALQCDVADLVVSGLGDLTSDVEPADAPAGMPRLGDLLDRRGLRLYRVRSDVLADAGVIRGESIIIDKGEPAIEARKAGDVLLLSIPNLNLLLLRQYLPPRLMTTNRASSDNSSLRLDDRVLSPQIVGIMVQADPG